MKINNSKKQLAKIISENGGWCKEAEFAWFQGRLKGKSCHEVWFGSEHSYPSYEPITGGFHSYFSKVVGKFQAAKFDNWHQTIITSDEYFHLYPAPDAEGWIEWKGGECPVEQGVLVDVRYEDGGHEIYRISADSQRWSHMGYPADIIAYRLHKPESEVETTKPERVVIEQKPTIEQLAAEYRNLKDYAERKQQEANAAKADAEAKLAELVAAGKALGLVLSVAGPEPSLVITDWRDLQVGDEIEYTEGEEEYMVGVVGTVIGFDRSDEGRPVEISSPHLLECDRAWPRKWRFIRRP